MNRSWRKLSSCHLLSSHRVKQQLTIESLAVFMLIPPGIELSLPRVIAHVSMPDNIPSGVQITSRKGAFTDTAQDAHEEHASFYEKVKLDTQILLRVNKCPIILPRWIWTVFTAK
jgi:hypothetical protein